MTLAIRAAQTEVVAVTDKDSGVITIPRFRVRARISAYRLSCDAGGKESDGGHLFTEGYETEDGLESGYRCSKCGMSNVSFSMWAGE
mgnify:CR=1 FL=1